MQRRRGYLERIILQANGCNEHQYYDPCSVIIRKFAEILIIELHEAHANRLKYKTVEENFLTGTLHVTPRTLE